MVIDDKLQFPKDFDKIGTLETFVMDHTFDPDTLYESFTKTNLTFVDCPLDYVAQMGAGWEAFIPK